MVMMPTTTIVSLARERATRTVAGRTMVPLLRGRFGCVAVEQPEPRSPVLIVRALHRIGSRRCPVSVVVGERRTRVYVFVPARQPNADGMVTQLDALVLAHEQPRVTAQALESKIRLTVDFDSARTSCRDMEHAIERLMSAAEFVATFLKPQAPAGGQLRLPLFTVVSRAGAAHAR